MENRMIKMEKWNIKNQISTLTLNKTKEVPYLYFTNLSDTSIVTHGFSTRAGGVSKGDCSTLNLSFTRGDDEHAVFENFRRLGNSIGFSCENLVFSDQTHTTNIRTVTASDKGKGFYYPRDYSDVDGLVTNVPGLVLATFYADCVPLYFVDPVHKAIGLSHSGWKGTVGKIGKLTVERMTAEYGTCPSDVIAAIGPSICQDCYEVSADVAVQFKEAFSKKYWDELLEEKSDEKFQLNLWRANELILMEAGVIPAHISVTNICTCCNSELLFSHRASHGKRGNLGAFLMLNENQ